MANCPCGSRIDYDLCCGSFHQGNALPKTAEALMRSRYSAFVKSEIDYLKETLWPKFQKAFNSEDYRQRAEESLWLGLKILDTKDGAESDQRGEVEFVAKSMTNGSTHEQRERSLFKKKNGQWYYVEPL